MEVAKLYSNVSNKRWMEKSAMMWSNQYIIKYGEENTWLKSFGGDIMGFPLVVYL